MAVVCGLLSHGCVCAYLPAEGGVSPLSPIVVYCRKIMLQSYAMRRHHEQLDQSSHGYSPRFTHVHYYDVVDTRSPSPRYIYRLITHKFRVTQVQGHPRSFIPFRVDLRYRPTSVCPHHNHTREHIGVDDAIAPPHNDNLNFQMHSSVRCSMRQKTVYRLFPRQLAV